MKWTIVLDAETPIYTQILRLVILGVSTGELEEGEALPPLRGLADALGVNLHTVRKAYLELAERGYIEQEERQKARIAPLPLDPSSYPSPLQREDLKVLLADGLNHGLSKEELRRLVDELLAELTERSSS